MSAAPALELRGIDAGYGQLSVIRDLSLVVDDGAIVALLGANGAGKSTTLRAVSGMIGSTGEVRLGGKSLGRTSSERRLRQGMAHVPEGRGTFPNLTVLENLKVGAITSSGGDVSDRIDRWFEFFPRLKERSSQRAGTLSGGEQQMLAVARAMMSRPRVLLLDEPSMGLAPNLTQALFAQLAEINRLEGTAMLVVEQNANLALGIASHGYVLESGVIATSGPAADLASNDDVRRAYLHV